MSNLYLLDCTLRDGGYVNDWKFGFGSIKSIFSRLDSAGIDAIEVGFLDDRRPYDPDRSIYPDTKSIEPVFANLKRPRALVTAMIDFGTCAIERLAPAVESSIDAIRVIFKKSKQDGALLFLQQIKEKGYKIIANPVSVTSYNDEEMISLVTKLSDISPYAVTIVDTYGLMHSQEVLHYCDLLNENLGEGIILGYHAHNNFQLAYANTIAVMNSVKDRDLSIDGTLFGMGKSAGNACTELIAMYMNQYFGKKYDINQIQEAIDIDIQKEYEKSSWGYRPQYYISALHDCHPEYVKYLMEKKSLSVKSVNELLEQIPDKDKLLYNSNIIEAIYQNSQNNYFDDFNVLKELKSVFSGNQILLIGPGKSIVNRQEIIDAYIEKNKPITISINFLDEHYPINYVFISNAKRYSQFFNKIYECSDTVKLICTSNITETREKIDYIVNFAPLISNVDVIRDNPLVLFLHLLQKMGLSEVTLAGFDGYVEKIEDDYYKEYIPFLYNTNGVVKRNEAITNEIGQMNGFIKVKTITQSMYLKEDGTIIN